MANTSTSLVGLGYTELVLGEQAWAVVMLLAAGALSTLTTWQIVGGRLLKPAIRRYRINRE